MNDDIDRGSISSLAEWSRVAKLQFAREDRGLREYSIPKPQSAGVWGTSCAHVLPSRRR